MWAKLFQSLIGIVLVLMSLGCQESGDEDSTFLSSSSVAFDVNLYKLNKLVCDPFDGGGSTSLAGGIVAELFYREQGQERFYSADRYIEEGQSSESYLFFSQIFVPTRRFELGFPTETGAVLKTKEKEDLVEYFGLRFKTILSLDESQEEGLYGIAMLSDDGSVLKIQNENGQWVNLVDNDGDHPTRMGCSDNLVYFSRDTQVPVMIDYYQGPRYHISLVPLWRKVNESTQDEPHCGAQGNSKFFDYNNGSSPQPAYEELMARGWRPWNHQNHKLPKDYKFNPCVEGNAPVISNFSVSTNGQSVVAVWETDILATSQLRVVNMSTGEELVTDSDNLFRSEHSVVHQGLESGVQYLIQAISISETYGKAISDPRYVIVEF